MHRNTFLLASALSLLAACGNGNDNQAKTELKSDSIMKENVYLNSFIDQVAWSMDSLMMGEDILLKTSPEASPLTPKQQIAVNLKAFEEIVNRQHERIAELEKSLEDNNSAHAQSMRKIINTMKRQAAEKDKEIAKLEDELNNKNFSIERLENIVSSLSKDVAGLTEKNKAQRAALSNQSAMMNEAYVLIGSKQELKSAGVLSGAGLFSKSKLNSADFDASKFQKVDIRKYKSVKLRGDKPKVLTPSPANSYTLTDNGDGTSTLTITNPQAFWGVSHYLVVQVK